MESGEQTEMWKKCKRHDESYPKSYRESLESSHHHHHVKPPHPKWEGTFNLTTLFEEESEDSQRSTPTPEYHHGDDHDHSYGGYSSSPNNPEKEGWRRHANSVCRQQ